MRAWPPLSPLCALIIQLLLPCIVSAWKAEAPGTKDKLSDHGPCPRRGHGPRPGRSGVGGCQPQLHVLLGCRQPHLSSSGSCALGTTSPGSLGLSSHFPPHPLKAWRWSDLQQCGNPLIPSRCVRMVLINQTTGTNSTTKLTAEEGLAVQGPCCPSSPGLNRGVGSGHGMMLGA